MKTHRYKLFLLTQGCQEFTDKFIKNPSEWSAFRNSDYGYARLQVFNHTHLYMEQVSVDKVRYKYKWNYI